MTFDQYAIMVLGTLSVTLSQSRPLQWRRWSSVVGLLAEPFWFYAAWRDHQPGIIFMVLVYSGVYAWGFYSNWIVAKKKGLK